MRNREIAAGLPQPNPNRLRSRCWNWTGGRNGDGYGIVRIGKPVVYVHRLSAYLWLGLDLTGPLLARHRCIGNRVCFNPAHLVAGTHSDNGRDTVNDGRWRRNAFTPQLVGQLIHYVRGGKGTIARWAALNGFSYRAAWTVYNGVFHAEQATASHARADRRYGPREADASRGAGVLIPENCRRLPGGDFVLTPGGVLSAAAEADCAAEGDDALPF